MEDFYLLSDETYGWVFNLLIYPGIKIKNVWRYSFIPMKITK